MAHAICGELQLRIHHCLLSTGSRDQIRKVYSKLQPLSQSRNWLATHLPRRLCKSSTSEAVPIAHENPDGRSREAQAATNYGLPVLVQNIEDNPDNITRFAIISNGPRGDGPR